MSTVLLLTTSLLVTAGPTASRGAELPAPEDLEFFEKKVRPLLVEKCYDCHSAAADEAAGGLYLDRRSGWEQGGSRGRAVTPGEPTESLLVSAVGYNDPDLQMPPQQRLKADEIAILEEWVRRQAPDPRTEAPPSSPRVLSVVDFEAGRKYWAFQPLTDPPRQRVNDTSWARDPLDTFVLARLENAGLTPSPEAGRAVLVRRLYQDLTGFSPSPSEVRRFVENRSPQAYEHLVDRLLASPHFGEKWARHWLDVARYGSDQSTGVQAPYPQAWRYRDWVIRAHNDDMPFDRFIALQLAADHFEPDNLEERFALGFLGLGRQYNGSELDDEQKRADEWDDSIDVVSQAFLGLTVACARCHDHKFDPVSTQDYYALAGVFASTRFADILDTGEVRKRPYKLSEAERKSPPKVTGHIVTDGEARDVPVFLRGNPKLKGELVPRRFLTVFSPDDRATISGSGRQDVARALAAQSNPLTSRVFVNRVWGHCFGEPLVRTANNFGRLGGRPTHPLLLDHLALRFVESNGSLKRLLRTLVLSATYRQTSAASPRHKEVDPDNLLLGHMRRRRLTIEGWRDAVLSVTGRLDRRIGGPPSDDALSAEHRRRTLYTRISRKAGDSLLKLFDFPSPTVSIGRRTESTTPLQHLFFLNSAFMQSNASLLAERLLASPAATRAERIDVMYRLLFSRAPLPDEREAVFDFLEAAPESGASERQEQWKLLAHTLLMSNGFRYVE